MAEIVNLRRARKGKARAEKDARVTDNRVRFGQTKAEKHKSEAESRRADQKFDGKKID